MIAIVTRTGNDLPNNSVGRNGDLYIDQNTNILYQKKNGVYVLYSQTQNSAGNVISFTTPQVYNSLASPGTGDITDNLTGARIGVVQKIYHNKLVAPTFPAGWVRLGSTTYNAGQNNIIYAEWVSGTRVEYWIVRL